MLKFDSAYHRLCYSAKERGFSVPMMVLRYIVKQYVLPVIASLMPNFIVTKIQALRGVKIGKDVSISRSAYIDESYPEMIYIGDGVRISHQAVITAHTSAPLRLKELGILPLKVEPVHIGNYVYIGANSTILPGVTIGECAIVAAGSVVNRDVPPYTMVAGTPARIKRSYQPPDNAMIQERQNK